MGKMIDRILSVVLRALKVNQTARHTSARTDPQYKRLDEAVIAFRSGCLEHVDANPVRAKRILLGENIRIAVPMEPTKFPA